MRLLVTNDDGVLAPGIAALARAMVSTGHDVVVAAPHTDMTGFGAALGAFASDGSIDVAPVELDGLDGVPAYMVTGPPALCVMAARLGGFGPPPDLVVSGINPGPNTGRATLHSGTVGAVLTGGNFGVSGLAVSIGVGDEIHWDTAGELAIGALEWLVDQPTRTLLNLNVPNVPLADVKGVRWATLAPFGTVRAQLVDSPDGGLQMELREHDEKLPDDSDTALVRDGYAAISSIVGIRVTAAAPVAEHVESHLYRMR
ncbi:MAG TPA: 5'/3'-nucleotidase SurE [Acidimicrobiales bacterium]|nr:5'/3'-nucleotidase SurE [Acidimicrobiales bacterium]